jgi:hypothetical protein
MAKKDAKKHSKKHSKKSGGATKKVSQAISLLQSAKKEI